MKSGHIDVAKHLKRYDNINIADKLALIKGLQELIEKDRAHLIAQKEEELNNLRQGVFPVIEKPAISDDADQSAAQVAQGEHSDEVPDDL